MVRSGGVAGSLEMPHFEPVRVLGRRDLPFLINLRATARTWRPEEEPFRPVPSKPPIRHRKARRGPNRRLIRGALPLGCPSQIRRHSAIDW